MVKLEDDIAFSVRYALRQKKEYL